MTARRTLDATTYTRKQDGKRYRTVAVAFTFRTLAAPLGLYLNAVRWSSVAQLALVGLIVAYVVGQ